jgi:DNA-binding MurR/RpiR family transcriptional regulator
MAHNNMTKIQKSRRRQNVGGQSPSRFPLVEKIRDRLQQLTPRQRAIGQYILNNPESLAFFSIVELAQKIGVSEATIVRFSNAMEFAGYSQLSSEIRQAIQLEYGSGDRFKLGRYLEGEYARKNDDSLFSRVISSEIDNLIRLAENVRSSQFHDCVERTLKADHLAVVGCQASYSLAVHMYQMIVKLLDQTDLFTQRSIHTTAKLHQYGKKSMLYLFSFPRYPKEGIDIAAVSKKRGTYVVVVTNSQLSPAAQIADQTILIDVSVPSFVDGYAAPLAFINALVTEVGMRRPEKAQEGLDHYDEFVAELGVFQDKTGEWRPTVDDNYKTQFKPKKRYRRK